MGNERGGKKIIDVKRIYEIFDVNQKNFETALNNFCLSFFVFNTISHSAFEKQFNIFFPIQIGILQKEKEKEKEDGNELCEVMKTTDGDECFYLSVKKQTMSDVLIKIFSSSWRYSIRTIENIPNQIKDLMLNLEVDIRKVFTMCNTTDDNLHQVPSFLPKVVAVNRMIHHKNLKNNLWQDENDNSSKRLAILQKEEKRRK